MSNLGAAFKGHDHDNSSSTAGRYYITDSSENLVRAASTVITGATTLVVRDTFNTLINNFGLADVKAVLSLTNVNLEITDASLTAAQYTTLDSQNGTGTISGPANLTGTAADLLALGGGVLGHASRTSITVTGATAAAADLVAIDAAASAPVNATAVGTITGNGADLVNAIDDQATLDTAADVVLNVTSGTVTVAQANLLANASTGIVTAPISDNAIATLNGLIADSVVNAYTVTVTGTAGAADLLALDDALLQLAQADPRKAELVELRFFAGLTNEQTASVTGLSLSTIEREWRFARAWLLERLGNPQSNPQSNPEA